MIQQFEQVVSNKKFIVYSNVISLFFSIVALGMVANLSKKYTEKVGFNDSSEIVISEESKNKSDVILIDNDSTVANQIDTIDNMINSKNLNTKENNVKINHNQNKKSEPKKERKSEPKHYPFALQIGSFTNEKLAKNSCENFVKNVSKNTTLKNNHPCSVIKIGNLFKVYLGNFESKDSAIAFSEKLSKNKVPSMIIKR